MAQSRIPVDLFNPGQVFGCLGFMELAEILLDDVEVGFDLSNALQPSFCITAAGEKMPVEEVLEYLALATVDLLVPVGYAVSSKKKPRADVDDEGGEDDADNDAFPETREYSEYYPDREADVLSLPVRLCVQGKPTLELSHWTDGSTRNTFKLYSGNRSADRIVRAMLSGVREKPKKSQQYGDLQYKGLAQLWAEQRSELKSKPFDALTPLGGTFNFDARGAWTALDAGYSPNTQRHGVVASPLVQILAACGLEHTRPVEFGVRQVRYCVWTGMLPANLARVAFQGGIPSLSTRQFRFELALSGKNKIVTFSQQENTYEYR